MTKTARYEPKILSGVLEFHSETGTEGGYWAFQDAHYIQRNVPRGWCKKCGKWLSYQPRKSEDVDPKWCPEGQHEEEIGDAWNYDGLHILRDGDYLVIYRPLMWGVVQYYSRTDPQCVLWQGYIKLKEHKLFDQHVFGLWMHNDQEDLSREEWALPFFWHYPARLVLKKHLGDVDTNTTWKG